MIIDSLKNAARYETINPYFKEVFIYLQGLDLPHQKAGKTILHEESLIININNSKLKTSSEVKLETHNKFIDIQLPLSGPETFGWSQRSDCKIIDAPFDPIKDIEFYRDSSSTYFTIQPGEFVIFFPEDAHAPCIGEGEIKKIVVKVKN